MKRSKNREINVFSVSFLDVLANTIGGLAFLLVLAVLMIGMMVFRPPEIVTERLPSASQGEEYQVWLSAREGMGMYQWEPGEGFPEWLKLDGATGLLHGTPPAGADGAAGGGWEFSVVCRTTAESSEDVPRETTRRLALSVAPPRPKPPPPVRIVTEGALPTAYMGMPYPLKLACEGGCPPYAWSLTEGAPPGLGLSQDGLISGQPSAEGTYPFSVRVASAAGDQAEGRLSLEVAVKHPPPPPPIPLRLLTAALPDAVAERDYRLYPAAEGGKPPYTWSVELAAKKWLSVGGDGGTVLGKPALTDIGEDAATLHVRDSRGETVDGAPVTLTVLPPPGEEPPPLELKTTLMPDARAGKPYDLFLSIRGGYPPFQWEAAGNHAAAGLAFDRDQGRLHGIPSAAGAVTVSVTVQDRAGARQSAEYAFTVLPGERALEILTESLPPGRAKEPYALALSASGGYAPYHWSLVSGELPPGLRLDEETGAIRGVPERAGDWRVEVAVADAAGNAAPAPKSFTLQMRTAKGFQKLEIKTARLPVLLQGQDVDLALACEGGDPPYTWTCADGLPAGLEVSGASITGAPRAAGRHRLELQVHDASGEAASAGYDLRIRHVAEWWLAVLLAVAAALAAALAAVSLMMWLRNRLKRVPLRILTESLPNARASAPYAVQLACEGGKPPYAWRVVQGEPPPGMTLSETGLLAGCPFEKIGVDETKEVAFTVEVTDFAGFTARQDL